MDEIKEIPFDENERRIDEMMQVGKHLYIYISAPKKLDIDIPNTDRSFTIGMHEKFWCKVVVGTDKLYDYPCVKMEGSPNESMDPLITFTLSVQAFKDLAEKGFVKEVEHSTLRIEEWDEPLTNNTTIHHIAQVLYDI